MCGLDWDLMDFSWTPEQIHASEVMAEVGSSLNDGLVAADHEGIFDRSKWDRIAASGVLGSCVPVELGGDGRDVMTAIAKLEGLGYGCRDNGLTLAVNGQMWAVQEPILRFGSREQKGDYIPRLISGELLGAHAMTEPESGSDTFALSTTATRRTDGYVLNGLKTMIGLAPLSDVALVFAKTAPERGKWGISAFIVETQWAGVTRIGPTSKMGLRTSPLGELRFDDCLVPGSALLGPEGAGASIFIDSMEWERSFIFTSHVGSMARQLDEAVEYATARRQFDRPIGQFQSVSNRIADMKLRLEMARLLLYRCAWLKANDESAQLESALTNLFVSEAFVANSLDAIRIHGGRGYLSDFEVERDLRDAVGGVIYSGTSDIQRELIARLLGL